MLMDLCEINGLVIPNTWLTDLRAHCTHKKKNQDLRSDVSSVQCTCEPTVRIECEGCADTAREVLLSLRTLLFWAITQRVVVILTDVSDSRP